MRPVRTDYHVAGWGSGVLWTRRDAVVLAHEFEFDDTVTGARRASHDPDERAAAIVARLTAFFAGGEEELADVAVDLSWCTPFQQSVAAALRGVPRGEVVSYGELAALAGHPNAQRAVGTFCARNPLALFVPCHRVVAADGVGGYGSAGVAVKRRLLALEGVGL